MDARVRQRLIELGRAGLGGFRDDSSREITARTLAMLAAGERLEWRAALGIVRDLARALEACEARGSSPDRSPRARSGSSPRSFSRAGTSRA